MIDFIVNPSSHGYQGRRIWRRLEKMLTDRGWQEGRDFALHETTPERGAAAIVRELTAGGGRSVFLAVIGGDGTLDEVACGLPADLPVRMAVYPSGSGNDFARSMGIRKDPERFVRSVMEPKKFRRLDLGEAVAEGDEATRRRFIVSSGIGFDAGVCFSVNAVHVRRVIRFLHLEGIQYTFAGLSEIFKAPPMYGTLTAGDRTIALQNARFVSAHIHPFEGGGYKFAPAADPSDGMLDLCVVNRCTTKRFLAVLVASLFRCHLKMKDIEGLRVPAAAVTLTDSFPAHRDGELYGYPSSIAWRCVKSELYLVR